MTPTQLISGHCLCKSLSYTIDHPLGNAALCHCEDCRRSTGASCSIVILAPKSKMNIQGDYKEYVTDTFSGSKAHRIFCPTCGSPIGTYIDCEVDCIHLKGGCLSEELQKLLDPKKEVFTKQRLPYLKDRFGLQYEENVIR